MNAQQKSTFVTVIAWIFLVLSGFGTLISLLQNVMVQAMFSSGDLAQAMQTPPPDAPPAALFMLSHFRLFVAGILVVTVCTLIASIGLLKRLNWARLLFVGLMMLGIAWNLAGLLLQFFMFTSMRTEFEKASSNGGPDMTIMFIAVGIVSVIMALAFCVLFGWIAKRLMSPSVVAEFREQQRPGR